MANSNDDDINDEPNTNGEGDESAYDMQQVITYFI